MMTKRYSRQSFLSSSSTSALILLVTVMLSCIPQPVASKDLMVEFWSPNLNQQPIPERFVNAGDTVTFKVFGPHTVFIHPSLSCDPTNRNELVPKNHEVTYTFQESDSGFYGNEMLFVCDAGSHCNQGQKVSFRVFPAPQPPSPAPTASPLDGLQGVEDNQADQQSSEGVLSNVKELPSATSGTDTAEEDEILSGAVTMKSIGMFVAMTLASILL